MTTNLPHRFREESFRRYEETIRKAVEVFPARHIINPAPWSCETVSCRLRDAMRSLNEHAWPTSIDMTKFRTFFNQSVVAMKDGFVVIGPRQAVKEPIGLKAVDESALPKQYAHADEPIIDDPSDELLQAVALVHHYRAKMTPTRFKFSKFSPDMVLHLNQWIGEKYDILLDADPATGVITIT